MAGNCQEKDGNHFYRYRVFALRPLQAFFIFCSAANSTTLSLRRACSGHMAIQCIQEMQRSLSRDDGLSFGIAWTGHYAAHFPHLMQSLSAFGFIGTP